MVVRGGLPRRPGQRLVRNAAVWPRRVPRIDKGVFFLVLSSGSKHHACTYARVQRTI